jgi:acyl-CoA carboxylase epsilon subunit
VSEPDERPVLKIIRGDATAEEVAAIVAVVASLPGPAAAPRARRPEWSAPHRKVRTTFPNGRGGWRSSSLPR